MNSSKVELLSCTYCHSSLPSLGIVVTMLYQETNRSHGFLTKANLKYSSQSSSSSIPRLANPCLATMRRRSGIRSFNNLSTVSPPVFWMWTKTTLRLSETNTLTQSSLWSLLNRLVYFAEEWSFNREPSIPGPAGRQICGHYGIRGYKMPGGRRTAGYEASPECLLLRRAQIVVPA